MRQKSVLIVEDDPDIRRMLYRLFVEEGFGVLQAENGKVALDILKVEKKPDLILLDLFMPEMDAVGFRKVQEMDPSISAIPVIVMSTDGMLDVKGLKLGLNLFVRKPIDIDKLLSVVQKVLTSNSSPF